MRTGKHSQKLTVLTLAVALAVAVYLNWEYARTGDIAAEPDAAQTSATAEDAVVVGCASGSGADRRRRGIRHGG